MCHACLIRFSLKVFYVLTNPWFLASLCVHSYVMASYASFLWDVEEEHGDMHPSPSSAPMSLLDDGGSALNSAILGRA